MYIEIVKGRFIICRVKINQWQKLVRKLGKKRAYQKVVKAVGR